MEVEVAKLLEIEPYYAAPDGGYVLYMGDSLDLLCDVPPSSVDTIFADPPYFLSNDGITCSSGRMVPVNKGDWDRSRGIAENHEFNLKWLELCRSALKKDGTIWVSGTSHVIHSVGFAMQSLGYKLLNDVVWYKRNAPPNLSCRYFTHSTETLLWAAKSEKSKHCFDYDAMKAVNGGKQMRNVWEISAPSKAEKVFGKHPTQKPLALLERIVIASTRAGDLVLDPFCGSGTTGLAGYKCGRRFAGIDSNEEYLDLAARRFEELLAKPELFHEQGAVATDD